MLAGCGTAGVEDGALPVDTAGSGTATLSWTPSGGPDVATYRVYVGRSSNLYDTSIDVGNQLTWTLTGLGSGAYYFAVTAYNTAGIESVFSNEVSKAFPN
jgi:hypothetical protein